MRTTQFGHSVALPAPYFAYLIRWPNRRSPLGAAIFAALVIFAVTAISPCSANTNRGSAAIVTKESKESKEPKEPREAREPKESREPKEFIVQIGIGKQPLQGTVTVPAGKGPFPGVVLVSGAGFLDRDCTCGPNKPFREIAQQLAARGIAVLRYDSRDFLYPSSSDTPSRRAVPLQRVTDARMAVGFLRNWPRVDAARVCIAGHSLGGVVACLVASSDADLPSAIVLSAPGHTTDELAGCKKKNLPIWHKEHERPVFISKTDWDNLKDVDAPIEALRLNRPLLVVQGANDRVIKPATEFARWHSILADSPQCKLKLYDGMNHALLESTDGDKEDLVAVKHVPPQLIADLASWIQSSTATSSLAARKAQSLLSSKSRQFTTQDHRSWSQPSVFGNAITPNYLGYSSYVR